MNCYTFHQPIGHLEECRIQGSGTLKIAKLNHKSIRTNPYLQKRQLYEPMV